MSIAALQRGLRALRLNAHYPDWRTLSAHLQVVGHTPPGHTLRWGEDGWPHPEEWQRVRSDAALAPELRPRLALQAARDPHSAAKLGYLEAMEQAPPLPDGALKAALVHQDKRETLVELVLDRLDLRALTFVRWTLRVADRRGDRVHSADLIQTQADPDFEALVRMLTTQSAAQALASLQRVPELVVGEVVRGEIGPSRPGPGGVWLSAVLSRASTGLQGARVDDPLSDVLPVPRADQGFGLSHLRKWAVPASDQRAARAWLAERGSRNLVYAYRPPATR